MANKFRKPYDRKAFEDKPTNAGKQTTIRYKETINEKGEPEYIIDDEEDVYEKIQEEAPHVLIHNLIKKYTESGEELKIENWQAVDTTIFPKNIFEINKQQKEAREQFKRLPAEVRNLFNNNPETFILEMATKEGKAKFESLKPNYFKQTKIEEKGETKDE